MNTEITHEIGLYLIGQTCFNPYTKKEYYLIKCGSTLTSFKDRLHCYYSHNPCVWLIEILPLKCKDTRILEKEIYYQEIIKNLSLKENVSIIDNIAYTKNIEWFCVSKEEYLKICEKGFKYLKTLDK